MFAKGFQFQKKKSRGFTLIELTIGIAAIAILMALYLRGSSILGKSKGVIEGQNILDTVTTVEGCFRTVQDYSALGATPTTGTTYVTGNCAAEVANPPSTVSGGAITNQFGGSRTVAKANINGGTNNALSVVDGGLPSSVCQEVLQNQWNTFDTITVTPTGGAAVAVKTASTTQFAPGLTASCSTAATASVTVVKAKN